MREELQHLSRRQLVDLVEQLMDRVEALEERVQDLGQRNAELEAALAKSRKNSSTSSKPPSSDIAGLLTWCGFPERKLLFRGEKYYYRT